jgi:hypothetical protein
LFDAQGLAFHRGADETGAERLPYRRDLVRLVRFVGAEANLRRRASATSALLKSRRLIAIKPAPLSGRASAFVCLLDRIAGTTYST